MARLVMPETGAAMPGMSYYAPAAPPAQQAPYYVIPQPAHYHEAPRYVYSPTEYGKLVPPQSYHYPVPVDPPKHVEAMKPIPQGYVAPNARHPVYVLPDGTMVGQPVHHHHGYPVYDHARHYHPSGAQYLPIAAESLPAAQPGMRWKLVPEDATPIVSPEEAHSPAPVMLLKSPEEEPDVAVSDPYKKLLSHLFAKPEENPQNPKDGAPAPVMLLKSPEDEPDAAVSDPYKEFLSRLFTKAGDKSQTKDGAPVVEAKGDTPRSVRIIPVTDALKDDTKKAMDQAPREEKTLKKQVNKPSAPTLKPIKLVPSLDFAKKKTSKQEKKPDSPQTCEVKVSAPEEKGALEKSVEDSGSQAKKRVITDSETAARLIQSVFRGFLVRRCQPLKHLRDIARVMKEYQALAANKSALLERCKDPAEWTKVSEAIMSLLLRLDVIQGVDPVVRDIRKYTSKEVLKLQSEVDEVKRQREEQVDDLLSQLLERLPSSGESVDTCMTSEVVKRLSFRKEQEQEKDADTIAGESEMGAGANCSDGVAGDDANLPVSSEVQKVAADIVDVVNAHSEDPVASVQSLADIKEDMLKVQGILDRTLPEVCEDLDIPNGVDEEVSTNENVESELLEAPTEIAGTEETLAGKLYVDDGEDEARTFEVEAHEEKVPDSDLLADLMDGPVSTEAAYGGAPHEADSVPLLADEETMSSTDMIADMKDDPSSYGGAPEAAADADSVTPHADEEKASSPDVIADLKDDTSSYGGAPEAATDADSVTLIADEEKIPNIYVVADLKDDPVSTEAAYEESGMAPEAATDPDSLRPLADEKKLPNIDLKDDPVITEAAFDSPEQATFSLPNGNDDAVEDTKVAFSIFAPSHSAEGLDSSCHDSPCQESEPDVATDSPSHLGVEEPCNTNSTPPNDESEDAEKSLKFQLPDKSSFSPQEGCVPSDSPTSVLDAGISMAPVDHHLTDEKETLQCAISDLESLNNEGECYLHDESLQLESAICDLHSLNNSGQGFLNDISPSAPRVTAQEVYLPKPPSLSSKALDLLEHGVESSGRLSPSSTNFSPRSEASLTQHLMEENAVLKELLKDVLKWSQWQSAATLGLQQMMEKLAIEVLETKATAKKAARCKHGKNKKAAKKRTHPL